MYWCVFLQSGCVGVQTPPTVSLLFPQEFAFKAGDGLYAAFECRTVDTLLAFGSNGRVSARVDCNRGSSTWKAGRGNELQFGSWSRTSAKCPPGSLHDKIVTEGANVRSYSIKDGHLFLSGMAAGGFYELEPLTTQKRQP